MLPEAEKPAFHNTGLTGSGTRHYEPDARYRKAANVLALLLPGVLPTRRLLATRGEQTNDRPKGKHIAFFSASVYYSLNFQQLVVDVHPEESNRLDTNNKAISRVYFPTLWEKSAWRNYFVSMLHS